MMRVEIGIKMERVAELILKSPNRLEDIRDLCLEIATEIDQYLQEVEDENYDHYNENYNEEEETESYDEEDEKTEEYEDYQYRYGNEEDDY